MCFPKFIPINCSIYIYFIVILSYFVHFGQYIDVTNITFTMNYTIITIVEMLYICYSQ